MSVSTSLHTSLPPNLSTFVDGWVKVSTKNPKTQIDGQLYAFDTNLKTLVILERSDEPKKRIQLVVFDNISEFNCYKKPESSTLAPHPYYNPKRIKARKEMEKKKAKDEADKIGVDVSISAQQIFNALDRTLPCRWEGTSIIVMDEIEIKDPYFPENCAGSNASALARVRRVLEGERQKLGK